MPEPTDDAIRDVLRTVSVGRQLTAEQAEAFMAAVLDGEVTEYDLEVWRMLQLQRAAAPEDWRTPFELDDVPAV